MIKELAKSMNVSELDLMCLAKSVVNSLIEDGAAKAFINADEKDKIKMIEAYVVHAVKKFESFHTTLLTNPEARKVFMNKILSLG